MVTIRLWGVEATIQDYRWRCASADLERVLNLLVDPDGPPTSDPTPDIHAAERIAQELGGEVLPYTVPKHVKGRIY